MIERTKLAMTGDFLTTVLRLTYERDGLDGARALVESGITEDQLKAVCDGRMRIEGSTDTELKLVEESNDH